jgi:serine/threonine protein kinase
MSCSERAELRGAVLDGRYRVGACIGIGGTGVVFEATRLADGAQFVVKTMRPCFAHNVDLGRRLRREAEVSRVVPHPGLVAVYDEGTLEDGSPYLILERIAGESLARLLLRIGVIAEDEAAAIGIRVAAILHAVHKSGYIHRDLKPEHVLLDRDANGDLQVRLLDFGVCSAATAPIDERRREQGRVFGTPSYVSPEQASGNPEVDERADVWGLGVVLFESLSGSVPFTASTVNNLLRRIIREDAPRVSLASPHVTWQLDGVIARALARDPESRWSTARAFARALSSHVGQRLTTERRLAQMLRVGSESVDLTPTARVRSPAAMAVA